MLAECDSKFVNINVQYPVFNAFVIESCSFVCTYNERTEIFFCLFQKGLSRHEY